MLLAGISEVHFQSRTTAFDASTEEDDFSEDQTAVQRVANLCISAEGKSIDLFGVVSQGYRVALRRWWMVFEGPGFA